MLIMVFDHPLYPVSKKKVSNQLEGIEFCLIAERRKYFREFSHIVMSTGNTRKFDFVTISWLQNARKKLIILNSIIKEFLPQEDKESAIRLR